MIHQTPARIYKAQQRGLYEDSTRRWYATFNFESYTDPHRKPFGALEILNDETLGPQQQVTRFAQYKCVLLIPLVGTLEFVYEGETRFAEPNEAVWLPLEGSITLKNPYERELVNFLFIEFKEPCGTEASTISINLEEHNSLNPFSLPGAVKAKMGIFDGRSEAVYHPKEGNGIFVFVISGAFEVQGRLLEERDALALWETTEADMEALSQNAVILLFEVPM